MKRPAGSPNKPQAKRDRVQALRALMSSTLGADAVGAADTALRAQRQRQAQQRALVAQVRALAARGKTHEQIREATGLKAAALDAIVRGHGIVLPDRMAQRVKEHGARVRALAAKEASVPQIARSLGLGIATTREMVEHLGIEVRARTSNKLDGREAEVRQALAQSGSVTEAARRLQVDTSTLRRAMQRLKLAAPRRARGGRPAGVPPVRERPKKTVRYEESAVPEAVRLLAGAWARTGDSAPAHEGQR